MATVYGIERKLIARRRKDPRSQISTIDKSIRTFPNLFLRMRLHEIVGTKQDLILRQMQSLDANTAKIWGDVGKRNIDS